jgi:multisubunit Na+/H+ antiporter MnhB subunit
MAERLPRRLLRLEGLAVLAASLVLYFDAGYGWLLLVVLFLAPDLAMIGYAGGPVVGAVTYDLVHTYAWPIALGVAGVLGDSGTAIQVALIWAAHIGADRLLGYGLKYPSGFKDTHLQRL